MVESELFFEVALRVANVGLISSSKVAINASDTSEGKAGASLALTMVRPWADVFDKNTETAFSNLKDGDQLVIRIQRHTPQ